MVAASLICKDKWCNIKPLIENSNFCTEDTLYKSDTVTELSIVKLDWIGIPLLVIHDVIPGLYVSLPESNALILPRINSFFKKPKLLRYRLNKPTTYSVNYEIENFAGDSITEYLQSIEKIKNISIC